LLSAVDIGVADISGDDLSGDGDLYGVGGGVLDDGDVLLIDVV